MKTNLWRKSVAIAVGLGAVLFGITAYAAVSQVIAVGVIPFSELFGGPATVTVRRLTIAPGEVLAWHYHPGRAYNVIKRGTLTVEDGCGGEEVLTAGQAFEEVDGRVHRAKNLGREEVEVYNTFIVPEGQPTTMNIANNERLCGPPRTASECEHGGWVSFSHPRSFKNQGDCVQYVKTGK
ncbi:MAG: cupin domain-containing protein [Acidobacteria bacterium]|nr:cupin domain-containing protein [Acidobacteriota bacterium]MCA1610255.1 cupin domain-containing protein [Acidobacteriota bacterium]